MRVMISIVRDEVAVPVLVTDDPDLVRVIAKEIFTFVTGDHPKDREHRQKIHDLTQRIRDVTRPEGKDA